MRRAAGPSAAGQGRPGAGPAQPWVNPRGVILALAAAVLLCWPMLLVTAPMGYADTLSYHATGAGVADILRDALPGPGGDAGPAGATPAGPGDGVRAIRSFPYGAFLYFAALTPLGLVLPVALQTALVLLLLLPLLPRLSGVPAWAVGGGLVLVGGLSTLPWFASYAMPDLLAAGVILYFMLLAGPMDALPLRWRLTLAAIAAFAVMSHYGNIPLAVALAGVVLLVRLRAGRSVRLLALLLALPVAAAVGINLLGSSAVLGEASWAPKRFPILLARSIADGPGLRYLEGACPEAGYAICEAVPGLPRDLGDLLWSQQGFVGMTEAELDRIRAEEPRLLWHAFLAYPLDQSWALLGNAVRQAGMVGTGEILPLLADPGGGRSIKLAAAAPDRFPALAAFDRLTVAGTLAGAALLAAALALPTTMRQDRQVVLVALLGILLNDLIFGGLSAPAERYQSRAVWILPALGVLLWLRRLGGRRAPAPAERCA